MKEIIMDHLEKAGIYSRNFRNQIADQAVEKIGKREIDKDKFVSWLSKIDYTGIRNITSYFLKLLETRLKSGLLDISPSESPVEEGVETEEEVLEAAQWWIDFFRDRDGWPGGVYRDRSGKIRGRFDGKGGFIYGAL